ncbi:MAG: hypothetical protein ACM336_22400 [Acidobacteriota bacterium]
MKRIVLFAAAALAFAGERDARILQFYASAGEVEKGASAIVCYGVENARAVRVDPPVEQLGLSRNRCFSITPARTTTYKLIASAANGSEISESLTVRVVPAPPRILFIDLSAAEAKLGQPFTLCYGVKNASSVRLDPLGWKLEPVEKNCRMWYPVRTLNYTLTASGAGGRKDQEKFTIKVK